MLSVSSCPINALRLAPSAARMATSRLRARARNRSRLATLAQAMSSTRATFTPDMKARLAVGHNAALEPVANWDIGPAMAGAGALRSSANDLLTFLAASLGYVKQFAGNYGPGFAAFAGLAALALAGVTPVRGNWRLSEAALADARV